MGRQTLVLAADRSPLSSMPSPTGAANSAFARAHPKSFCETGYVNGTETPSC